MENKFREALDQITAQPGLRAQTRRAVIDALRRKTTRRRSSPLRYAMAAACLLLLLGLGGYGIYMTPVATISVDINPSLELAINRFDRVIGAQAFNEDAQEVLSSVRLKNLRYPEALELLLRSEAAARYLAGDADILITVLGNTDADSQEMLQQVRECDYTQRVNVSCHSGHHENADAAHSANLSLGKYEAYLILHELDKRITPEDVRLLSMREIRLRIEELRREMADSSDDSSDDSHSSEHESGHGKGHHS